MRHERIARLRNILHGCCALVAGAQRILRCWRNRGREGLAFRRKQALTTTVNSLGGFGNQLIRNLCVSLVAEKHNLQATYSSHESLQRLGIPLFSGQHKYGRAIKLSEDTFFPVLHRKTLKANVDSSASFFQTKEITQFLWSYLQENKHRIIDANPFRERYSNNNDCCVHIRLGDAVQWNPGVEYYKKALSALSFDRLYIGTDSPSHPIIEELTSIYPSASILPYKEVETIQFASTAKHTVLSHGSFSAVIGWLSFFSSVYYPEHKGIRWYGDMFSIPGWKCIEVGLGP